MVSKSPLFKTREGGRGVRERGGGGWRGVGERRGGRRVRERGREGEGEGGG